MGIISNVLMRNYSMTDFNKDFETYFYAGAKSNTGVRVTEESALKFSAVYACVRAISEDIGMLPIELRKWRDINNKSKGSDIDYAHPLNDCLSYEPNSEMNAMTFSETLQSHILLSGNGYAYKYYDGRGRINKLKLLDWKSIAPVRINGEIKYSCGAESNKIEFEKWEIFHIPGLGFDGLTGRSPVRMAMEAIGLGLAAEEFGARFFSNGANVGGVITMPGSIKDKEGLKKEFNEKWGSLEKSHKVMFLEEGMKFEKMVMPLNEAQFLETRKFQVEEIARIYRTPHHIIQHLDHSTFSNIEHQDLEYTKHTLLPWIRRWEQAIDTQLLTKNDRMAGYFAIFNIEELLRGDSITKANTNHIKRQDGVITGNEWRSTDGMNPRPEPEADKLIINGNMRDISVVNSTAPVITGGEKV